MANRFQIKRTTTSGRTPNTTSSGNTTYIAAGELAINLTDDKLFSSDGTNLIEVGSNLSSLSVTGNVGIGTASPATKLAVVGGIAGTAGLNISGNGWGVLPYVANSVVIDNNTGESRFFATGADASTHGKHLFYTGTTNGTALERMRIDSAGNIGIGNTTPTVKLAISSTDAILIPVGTTAQRPTGAIGYMRFNSNSTEYEGYNGNTWSSVGTASNGLVINAATVIANSTVGVGYNAMSVGPITIANGVSVSISSGQRWLVF
jgi:hypothetical protein